MKPAYEKAVREDQLGGWYCPVRVFQDAKESQGGWILVAFVTVNLLLSGFLIGKKKVAYFFIFRGNISLKLVQYIKMFPFISTSVWVLGSTAVSFSTDLLCLVFWLLWRSSCGDVTPPVILALLSVLLQLHPRKVFDQIKAQGFSSSSFWTF